MDYHYNFFKWFCDTKLIDITDKKGELTPQGQVFVKKLQENPNQILKDLKDGIRENISSYVLETNDTFAYDHMICEELLEFIKKRFLKEQL